MEKEIDNFKKKFGVNNELEFDIDAEFEKDVICRGIIEFINDEDKELNMVEEQKESQHDSQQQSHRDSQQNGDEESQHDIDD